ncbi:MAG TPA: hypothetical protein VE961_26810 [Pyrinomonadaceae bacterium]|nr:hypothetical protein [Pyrinomonadaceae bacterium]
MAKSPLLHLILIAAFWSGSSAAQTPAAKPLDWRDFNAGDGGFTVKLPGTPKLSTPEFKVGPVTLATHAYSLQAGDYGFEIYYMDLPAGSDPDSAMEGGVSNMINSAIGRGATVISNETVNHGNCAAREVSMSTVQPGGGKHGFTDTLVLTSGMRMYTVVYGSLSDTTTTRDVGRTFINSFMINGGCTSMIAPGDAPNSNKTEESIEGNPDPATGWRIIESSDLGVRVLMPGSARHVVQKESTQLQLTHHTFVYSNEESVYSAEVIGNYPDGWHTTPASYQTSIDLTLYALKKNLGAVGFEITPVRDLRLGTNPGREFSLINPARGSHGRAQIYVTVNRIYVLMAFTRSENPLTQISQYFSSVRISPK